MNNKKISVNLCTVCHKSFNISLTDNRKMCPGCRVQKRESKQERGHGERLIYVLDRMDKMVS